VNKLLIPALLFGALYFFFQGKQVASNAKYDIKDVALISATVSKLNLRLTLTITNPSDFAITAKKIIGDILYKGKSIARIITTQPIDIAAQAATDIKLPVAVPTGSLSASVLESILDFRSKGISPNVQIKGVIYFNVGSLNIDETKKLEV
jgi:LEA14-like dessication related protein